MWLPSYPQRRHVPRFFLWSNSPAGRQTPRTSASTLSSLLLFRLSSPRPRDAQSFRIAPKVTSHVFHTPPVDMNRQNEKPVLVEGRLATEHREKSGQMVLNGRRRGTAMKPMSQNATASSTSATPGQPGGKVVKQTAKRTPRARLIAMLNRANGIAKAAQPAAKVSPETLEAVSLSAGGQDFTSNGSVTILEATLSTMPESKAQQPVPLPNTAPQNPVASAPSAGRSLSLSLRIDGRDFSLVNRVAYAPSKSAKEGRRSKIQDFDSASFDAVIYQQPTAMKPPPGVLIPARPQRSLPSSSDDQRMYLHINPAIHLSHNRSEGWFKAKAEEIKSRGGRKAWFGKVIERQRWLHAQKNHEEVANGKGSGQRRANQQPWTYSRPMDFGDLPASQLPDDVLKNAAWLKACAWHREIKRIRALRHREAKRSKQETQEFYKTVMAGMHSSSGH
ncbi:Uncharacterized protein TCAP_03843 [Tolypocladium capitatum]|uniref:Uncharacterized protein n=1 Tax=Tolypocladium capitatum TaxID=45235 RepID=A0A2K3QFA6_9HYPO|nr:Uncharacterized protein TCAP_03843 [Tolypocladium capitatum]